VTDAIGTPEQIRIALSHRSIVVVFVVCMTGESCRELRQRLGITQAKLCWHLGLDPALISRWECGVGRLRPAQCEAITAYLAEQLEAAKQEIAALEVPQLGNAMVTR
jgi:predicted transcriptional regulator